MEISFAIMRMGKCFMVYTSAQLLLDECFLKNKKITCLHVAISNTERGWWKVQRIQKQSKPFVFYREMIVYYI